MVAEIVCVGTELLLGDIVNTNAQHISKELAHIGIDLYYQTVVGDNKERVWNVLIPHSDATVLIFTAAIPFFATIPQLTFNISSSDVTALLNSYHRPLYSILLSRFPFSVFLI